MEVGAARRGDVWGFAVWAPLRQKMELLLEGREPIPLVRDDAGCWRTDVHGLPAGALYRYRLDGGTTLPDPASHAQPQGVHGPSALVEHPAFPWQDGGWRGIPLDEMILYELHVGTFTPEGTFDGVATRLPELREVGVNAIELMPVASFPGRRNWGYDGVYPYSVQASYGGPEGLKRLVDACHRAGMAVVLDVVYNHLGPEGNYLGQYGPYFTEAYRTPWGQALNFDGPWSDGVRDYFVGNALHWFDRYHVDGLRLDAVHAIYDASARPFLQELSEAVRAMERRLGRRLLLIAESDRNDARLVRPPALGGLGLDAAWCDDFHHSLHALLTGEQGGYYEDFGRVMHLAKAYREGFVYSGEHSRYRKRRHGTSSRDVPGSRLVVFSQNHDQIGNRMLGERLSTLLPFEALKLAAAAVILSPCVPLLFMGEEHGEEAPFLYFTDHGDPGLVRAVREGRKSEFRAFGWVEDPPDPQSPETLERSKLRWEGRREGRHGILLSLHRELIGLRRAVPALAILDKDRMEVTESGGALAVRRWCEEGEAVCLLNPGTEEARAAVSFEGATMEKRLDTSEARWEGPGATLPERLARGAEVCLPPCGFAAYTSARGGQDVTGEPSR